jgi:thiol:disulfide interchange protein
MTRLPLLLVALTLVVMPVAAGATAPEGADNWNSAEISWKDMRTGVKEATETGKPVLMLFQATWCSACKKYRGVFRDAEVVAASRDLVMILVDIDKTPQINSAFSPDGVYVPRTIFLHATGEIRHDLKGADPQYPHSLDISEPSELLSLMKKAVGGGVESVPSPDKRAEGNK